MVENLKGEIKQDIREEEIINERRRKAFSFLKKTNIWVLVLLIAALILGVYIRSLPMSDHGGHPGLWDITTNTWTLGPDLDPFLFLRYAKEIIANGGLERTDMMRNVPLGFDTTTELQMVSYMIVITHKILSVFGYKSVDLAGVFMPVLLFALTILAFFFFVREVFTRKNEKTTRANIIAIISTFFMIVIPIFLSRTVAGIPEKESVGFFFIFLSFYLFLKAWKSEKLKHAIIFGILAGISTGLMGLTWGGVQYIYATISIAGLTAFILNKFHKKEVLIYFSWIAVSFLITFIFTNRFSVTDWATSLDTGLTLIVLLAAVTHMILWKTKLAEKNIFKNSKLPRNILSIIVLILFLLALLTLISIINLVFSTDFNFGLNMLSAKVKAINQMMFRPVTGRWSMTVAENRQPYFGEWASNFGPFIKGIPVLFWLFFAGSVLLFKKMLYGLKKKDALILTFFYVLFFFGLVFSRYAAHPSILDGENFLSKALYYGFGFLLIAGIVYFYTKYYKEKTEGFEKTDFEILLLFVLFALCLFTARSAVRLIMVLGPVAPIFLAYLVVESVASFRRSRDETEKMIYGGIMIALIILSLFVFWNFYKQVKSEAYSFVPNIYTQQWQKGMQWVRNNTAEDAVFAHWWDYGYWLQSIGKRATVTDGGNAIVWWNYLTGRYVLTGDNQKDALEFLHNHNADYLLIDSTDIGKYGAYSQIGSNKNFDRLSWIPVMSSDATQMQETKNGRMRLYAGGSMLDEDMTYNNNGSQVFLPSGSAGIGAVIVEIINTNGTVIRQPTGVFIYQNKEIRLPLRYAYYNRQFYDFGSGVEAAVRIIARASQSAQGAQIDYEGALIYLSPRVLRGLMGQIYLLNDPFKKFQNFEIEHSEPSIIVDSLNSQGAKIDEFVIYGDIHGPIKIWKIKYNGDEKENPDYLRISSPDYIDWQF